MPSIFAIEASFRGVDLCNLDIMTTAQQLAKDRLTEEQRGEYKSYMDRVGWLLDHAKNPAEEDAAVIYANKEFPLGAVASSLVDEYATAEERRIRG